MKSLLLPICLASFVTVTGCASSGSMAPMATVPTAPPLECRVMCSDPPSLATPREMWDAAIVSWGADCAALHRDCVEALRR